MSYFEATMIFGGAFSPVLALLTTLALFWEGKR